MNTNEIHITKTFSAPREVLFKYFIQPELIEKWSAPDGFTLKVPQFEAKVGGRYRYEHTAKDGVYLCEGKVIDFVSNDKIVMVDEFIKGPNGKNLGENIENSITLKDAAGGTEVTVDSKGNFDDAFKAECESGWNQCFENLAELIAKETGAGFTSKSGEVRPNA